jgi:hypothetical protein
VDGRPAARQPEVAYRRLASDLTQRIEA